MKCQQKHMDEYFRTCGITGCHIERNTEFPSKNTRAKPVYITAIEWKCSAAQHVQYYTQALFYAHKCTHFS